ncbi:S41 family peptidase [Pararcticibacter amylolyticus]|nr:S41 family peptidase [Pararcticibacter amylolyticus]
MPTRKNLIIAGCYAGTLVLGMLLGPKFQKENGNKLNGTFLPFLPGGREEKIETVFNIIKDNYVDPVNIDSIGDEAINEVLKNLDPHSSYLPPTDAKLLSEDLEGNYNGIGVEYRILNDTLLVTGVNKRGPAAKAGLKTGDRILAIGNVNIAGTEVTSKKIVELIRGRRGTAVKLMVQRFGWQGHKQITVLRDKITVSSIDIGYMISGDIGYIRISKFGARTDEDFVSELERLKKQGLKSLILDLRENGGGYLSAATALSDQFLGEKKLIVYTQGAHEPRTDYFATKEGKFEQGKLVVLIDENTASASEVVAGAVQDLDRGTIIGRRSFGKGLVQEQFNFGDGSALNLTVARYYTPSGRSIQKSYKEGANAYFEEVLNRHKNGELNSDRKHLMDSLYKKGKTYKTASGRLIYGGGGIMPDIYVPVDTAGYNDLYFALNAKGVLNDFLYNSLVKTTVPRSLDEFVKKFNLSKDQYRQLFLLADKRGVKYQPHLFKDAQRHIHADLKALLARYYFGEDGYYKVLNSDDTVISRSLAFLKQP